MRITIDIEDVPESWVEPISGEKRGRHEFCVGEHLITVRIPEKLYSDPGWEGKHLFGKTLECFAEALLWSLHDTDEWLGGRKAEGPYGSFMEFEPHAIAVDTLIVFEEKLKRARAFASGSLIERIRRFFGR